MIKRKHFVVFGAGERPNKGLLAFKDEKTGMYAATICEVENDGKYDFGDTIDMEDIRGEYTTLYFAKLESLISVIRFLELLRDKWKEENAQ